LIYGQARPTPCPQQGAFGMAGIAIERYGAGIDSRLEMLLPRMS
jgi:hypothetical protein